MISVLFSKPDPAALRRRTRGWRQLVVWLPVVFAIAVICTESTDTFSAEHTSGWLRPVVERWLGHISDAHWELWHHIARKTGHFLGYGLVCLSFLRAWLLTLGCRAGLSVTRWLVQSQVLAVASTAFVASMDEWHQTFIPSRTGKVSDVLLDTTGAIVLCGLMALLRHAAQHRTSPRLLESA